MHEKPSVLLADDDEAYRVLVPDILEDFHVSVAPDVRSACTHVARAAVGEVECDVVILDFHLDEGNARIDETGADVLKYIRESLGPDFPVIGFSGRTMETHNITDVTVDATKDGLFDLSDIISRLLDRDVEK